MENIEYFKKQAAKSAVDLIEPDMVVGLGSGSTAWFALQEMGRRLQNGTLQSIVGIPSSDKTARAAGQFGIPLTSLDLHPRIDVTIDGADEVAPDLNVIKGAGGALLREKILAQASNRLIIIVDETKVSDALGLKSLLPVEVLPFACTPALQFLEEQGLEGKLRIWEDGKPFLTDQKNYIIDCRIKQSIKLEDLVIKLKSKAGIIEHGLFQNLVTDVIVAGATGVRLVKRTDES